MRGFVILTIKAVDERFYGTDRYGEKVTMYRVVDKHGDVWYSTVDRKDAETFIANRETREDANRG